MKFYIELMLLVDLLLLGVLLVGVLTLGLAGAKRLFKRPAGDVFDNEPAKRPSAGVTTGGAPIAAELGQFMPRPTKTPFGVTNEELEWAREQGAKTDAEAAELIFENRKTMQAGQEDVSPSGS